MMKRLHLVTDDGFAKRFVLYLVAMAATSHVALNDPYIAEVLEDGLETVKLQLLTSAHRMAWWSAIGLLSSSCCVIQLLVSAFSFGCAGFNTILGPARPALLSAALLLQIATWRMAWNRPWLWVGTASSTMLSALLSFSPEILCLLSSLRGSNVPCPPKAPGCTGELELDLGSAMGCASCVHTVQSTLLGHSAVALCEVDFAAGQVHASLNVPCSENIKDEILQLLSKSGFPAKPVELSASTHRAQPSSEGISRHLSVWVDGHNFLISTVAGLLGSSCCALQLTMNLLSALNLLHGIGCAGFNKVLGPPRFVIRLCSASWLSYCWVRSKPGLRIRLLRSTLICALMTFLPEMLLMGGGPALAPPALGAEKLTFKVSGLGCEACQYHVQGALERSSGVVSADVNFEGEYAEVWVQPDWAFDFSKVYAELLDDGYELIKK